MGKNRRTNQEKRGHFATFGDYISAEDRERLEEQFADIAGAGPQKPINKRREDGLRDRRKAFS